MKRILVIEDERQIRQFVVQTLKMEGYEVIGVSSGNQALDLLEQDSNFDLIVSDLLMPDGGGVTFIKNLQQAYFHIPIVLMSAHITRYWPEEAIRRSAGQLIKPFIAMDLIETVREAIENGQPQMCG
jgi:DNA-binding NtrC family response regulator